MSIAPPEAPTGPTTVTDIHVNLVEEVDDSYACQWNTLWNHPVPECPSEATWLVVFREVCEHGAQLRPGDPILCKGHAVRLQVGGYGCGGCTCIVTHWGHVIERFVKIK